MRAHVLLVMVPVVLIAGCSGAGNQPVAVSTTTVTQTPTFDPKIQESQRNAADASLRTLVVDQCHEMIKASLVAPMTALFNKDMAVSDPVKRDVYTVTGTMQSTNRMGVPIGASFVCTSSAGKMDYKLTEN